MQSRAQRIKYAVWTSLASKATTFVLQLAIWPALAHGLAVETFALFSLLAAIPGFLALLDLGVGPALAQKVSASNAKGDQQAEARYVHSALILVLVSVAIGLSAAMAGVHFGLIDSILGQFGGGVSDARSGAFVMLSIVGVQLIGSVGQKTRLGYQEVHVNNLFGAAGNLLIAFFVAMGLYRGWGIGGLLLAAYGPQAALAILNLSMLFANRTWLRPCPLLFERRAVTTLLSDSVIYGIAFLALNWQRELGKFFLAGVGPDEVAIYAAILAICGALGGGLQTVTGSVWPSLLDAKTRADGLWLRRARSRLCGLGALIAVCSYPAIVFIIGPIVTAIYPDKIALAPAHFNALAYYFSALALGHIVFTWNMAMGRGRLLCGCAIGEFALSMLLVSLVREKITSVNLLFTLGSSHLLVGVVVLIVLASRGVGAQREIK